MKYIGNTHILVSEFACPHCKKLPVGFFTEDQDISPEYSLLLRDFEEIRSGRGGRPLAINSGYRCLDHHRKMYDAWVAGGKKGVPHAILTAHLFGLALDLQAVDFADQDLIVALARKLKPAPRIGWKSYRKVGSKCVHIDLAFLVEPQISPDFQPGVEW